MLLLSEELVFFALIMEQELRSFVLMLRLNKESSTRATSLNYVISIYIHSATPVSNVHQIQVSVFSRHIRDPNTLAATAFRSRQRCK